jgi:hypothetical protein
MTHLFLIAAPADDAAQALQPRLQALDYAVWQPPPGVKPDTAVFGRLFDNGVLSSLAVVAVWGAAAQDDEWVERALLVAGRLRKPIYIITTDASELPAEAQAVAVPAPEALAERLAALRQADELALAELDAQLAHAEIRVRRAGIEQARAWLADPARAALREHLLARLEFMAQYELILNLRDLARATLEAVTRSAMAAAQAGAPHHRFGVRCKNGHVTYFDRRRACGDYYQVPRVAVRRAGTSLSELYLPCNQCSEKTKVRVDCEDY